MEKKLYEILSDIRPEIDFTCENNFVDNGLFDSYDITLLLDSICEEFDVELGLEDLKKENFNTIGGMINMIKRAQNVK